VGAAGRALGHPAGEVRGSSLFMGTGVVLSHIKGGQLSGSGCPGTIAYQSQIKHRAKSQFHS
jgi:hypothetical protein